MEHYIEKYNLYRKNKADQYKSYKKIKTPETSKRAWGSIIINWIIKLPSSKEPMTEIIYNLIFIITNLLTKYTYFIPYIKELGAEKLIY